MTNPTTDDSQNASPDTTITVGDYVRSFDFPDSPRGAGHYYEGVIVAVVQRAETFTFTSADGFEAQVNYGDCDHYAIRVTRRVWDGEPLAPRALYVFPPVNGTAKLFGGVCHGVTRISALEHLTNAQLDKALIVETDNAQRAGADTTPHLDRLFAERERRCRASWERICAPLPLPHDDQTDQGQVAPASPAASEHQNDLTDVPAAACRVCGGWTPMGGCSQHANATTPVMGRTGCTCHAPQVDLDTPRQTIATVDRRDGTWSRAHYPLIDGEPTPIERATDSADRENQAEGWRRFVPVLWNATQREHVADAQAVKVPHKRLIIFRASWSDLGSEPDRLVLARNEGAAINVIEAASPGVCQPAYGFTLTVEPDTLPPTTPTDDSPQDAQDAPQHAGDDTSADDQADAPASDSDPLAGLDLLCRAATRDDWRRWEREYQAPTVTSSKGDGGYVVKVDGEPVGVLINRGRSVSPRWCFTPRDGQPWTTITAPTKADAMTKINAAAVITTEIARLRQLEADVCEEASLTYRDPCADVVLTDNGDHLFLSYDGAGFDWFSPEADMHASDRTRCHLSAGLDRLGLIFEDYSTWALSVYLNG